MIDPASSALRRSRSAVFRADAGSAIGLGHVARCAALAEHLFVLGWTCHLVAPMPSEAPFDLGMFATISPPARDEEETALPPTLRSRKHDLFVIDHYGLGAEFERAARAGASRLLVLDDLARAHVADMLVDGADAGRARAYEGLLPAACEVLAGPDHVPLRALVFAARANSIRSRQGPVRRLLLSLGSGNTADLTRGIVEQALKIAPGCRIDVISSAGEVPAHDGVTMHRTTGRMVELMASSDAAIGAGAEADRTRSSWVTAGRISVSRAARNWCWPRGSSRTTR